LYPDDVVVADELVSVSSVRCKRSKAIRPKSGRPSKTLIL
jgi:hypothetical protein